MTIEGATRCRLARIACSVSADPHAAPAITGANEQVLAGFANAVAAAYVGKAIIGTGVKALTNFTDPIAARHVTPIAILRTVAMVFARVAYAVAAACAGAATVLRAVRGRLAGFAVAVSALLPIGSAVAGTIGHRLAVPAETVSANFTAVIASENRDATVPYNQTRDGKECPKHKKPFLWIVRSCTTQQTTPPKPSTRAIIVNLYSKFGTNHVYC